MYWLGIRVCPLRHLPRQVINSIGTLARLITAILLEPTVPAVRTRPSRPGSSFSNMCGATARLLISPGIRPSIDSPGCFLPLLLGWQPSAILAAVGYCIVPINTDYWQVLRIDLPPLIPIVGLLA